MIIPTDKNETKKIFDDHEELQNRLLVLDRPIRKFDIELLVDSFDKMRASFGVLRSRTNEDKVDLPGRLS